MTRSDHPLRTPSHWYQYESVDHARQIQETRSKELVETELIGPGHRYGVCRGDACGMYEHDAGIGTIVPSPLKCSALCHVAQARLERLVVPRLSEILMSYDEAPLFVTGYDPSSYHPATEFIDLETGPARRWIQNGLRAASRRNEHKVAAVGRLNIDLGLEGGMAIAQQRFRLIVAGGDREFVDRFRGELSRSRAGEKVEISACAVPNIGALRYALKCEIDGFSDEVDEKLSYARNVRGLTPQIEENFSGLKLFYRHVDFFIVHGLKRRGALIHVGGEPYHEPLARCADTSNI